MGVGTVGTRVRVGTTITGFVVVVFDGRGTSVVGIQMEGLGTVRMGEPMGAVERAVLGFGRVRIGDRLGAVGRAILGREEAGGS